MRKIFLLLLLVVAIVVTLSPYLLGMVFQYQYQQSVKTYNSEQNIKITQLNYHRKWFYSTVDMDVEIINPEIQMLLNTILPSNEKTILHIHQNIKHGPIIFSHFKPQFKLAAVSNHIQIGASPFILETKGWINYNGKYFQRFHFPQFTFTSPSARFHLTTNSSSTMKLWMNPEQHHFAGELGLHALDIRNQSFMITIPKATLQFDQHKDDHGFWLGEVSAFFPEFHLIGEPDSLNLSSIHLYAVTTADEKFLNGERELIIDNMQLNQQPLGSLHIKVKAFHINGDAVVNIIQRFRKTLVSGEQYESQLQRETLMTLPKLIYPGTQISLNKLDYQGPQGNLEIKGEVSWPEGLSSPDDLQEFFQMATVKLFVRMSKTLAEQVISLASQSPYFYDISEEDRKKLLELQNNINSAMKRNFLMISSLTDEKQISTEIADDLFLMQQDNEDLTTYGNYIQSEYLKRKITLYTSYLLRSHYAYIQQGVAELENKINSYQRVVQQQLREGLSSWIKQGYVTQNASDYQVNLVREQGKYRFNN